MFLANLTAKRDRSQDLPLRLLGRCRTYDTLFTATASGDRRLCVGSRLSFHPPPPQGKFPVFGSVQVAEVPQETHIRSVAAEVGGEEAAKQPTAERQVPPGSTFLPPPEADTKEAAYARMQALLAERNGLPPPHPLPAPAPLFRQQSDGAFVDVVVACSRVKRVCAGHGECRRHHEERLQILRFH